MDFTSWKPYILISIIVPTIIVVLVMMFAELGIWGIFIEVILLYLMFPCIMAGVYMWATGNGSRWINGPDWTKMSENTRNRGVRVVGIFLSISMVVILYGVISIFYGVTAWGFGTAMILFAVIMIAGVALLLYSVVLVSRKSFEETWRYKEPVNPSKGKILAVTLIFAISMVPVGFSVSSIGGNEEINITLNDDDFLVKAPMFDHTFAYDEIDTIYLDTDFEKGSRISGYGTNTIKSGNFRNSEFGDYKLASYAKVTPCIVIMVDGNYYAFNQSSDSLTEELYQDLLERIQP